MARDHPTPPHDAKARVRRVKRWVASATMAGFAGFVALAATHPVGATTTGAQSLGSASTGASQALGSGAQATRSPSTVSPTTTSRRTASSRLSNRTSGDAVLSTGSS
jgi:hypothetical protein